jgi:apolipoprotein N-acyltransferase
MVSEAEGYARSNQDLSPTNRPGYLLHNSRSAATPAAVASASSAAAGQARPGWPGLPRWWSLLTAFAAGLALAGAFPPFGFWPLASAGPALLILALWGKRYLATFTLALICGLTFFVALLSWLVNVAWYAWLTLGLVEALIFAVLALALRPLLRLRFWPLAVGGWWVAQEAVHDRYPWGGFPWGRLAMSQPAAPTAGWSAIGGPPLLSFLLALAGACLACLVIAALGRPAQGRPVRREVVVAAAAAVAAAAILTSGNLIWTPPSGPSPTARIATVQGNVPHARNLPNLLRATTVTENHAQATIALARQIKAGRRPAPDLVIWPENSTDIDPRLSPPTYAAIAAAVNAIAKPVLVGAVLNHPLRNAGQLWLPRRGPVEIYVKRQLVPFGEVIPLRGLLDRVTSLPELQPRNFTPGHRGVVFRIGKIRLGDVICYEVGFDNLVRSEVRAGANLLTVQTNDADFELNGQLGESLQQLAMARIDAISTGRAVAVASTTGLSAIVAPDGSIVTQSKTWRRAILERRVPLRSALTPAVRAGAWPELGIIALTLLALAWAIGTGWRRRRTS